MAIKTSVCVSVYMVEKKGIKIENIQKQKKNQTEMIMTATEMKRGKCFVFSCVGCRREEPRNETGGCLRRTISPVCGGPWRGRGTLMGAGCCCLLRLSSSYTLDTCHAVWPHNRILVTLADIGRFLTSAFILVRFYRMLWLLWSFCLVCQIQAKKSTLLMLNDRIGQHV